MFSRYKVAGLSFVERLLQKEAWKKPKALPKLAVANHPQADDRPTAKQALCDPFLLSGVASSNLCAAIQRPNACCTKLETRKQNDSNVVTIGGIRYNNAKIQFEEEAEVRKCRI